MKETRRGRTLLGSKAGLMISAKEEELHVSSSGAMTSLGALLPLPFCPSSAACDAFPLDYYVE